MEEDQTQQEQIDEGKAEQLAGDKIQAKQKGQIKNQQDQQAVTNKITTAHTEHFENQDKVIEGILAGVDNVAGQVATLNDRVYSKNVLDQTRNRLFRITILASFVLAGVIAALLVAVVVGNSKEASRAKDRARESASFRHQLADCQLPSGTVLEDGYVNIGTCFNVNVTRTNEFLELATTKIFNGLRLSADCLYLRSIGVRPSVCDEVNSRVDSLQSGQNPFVTTTLSRAPTVTTVRGPTTTITRVTTTTTPRPTTTRSTTTTTTTPNVLCNLLRTLGVVCDA